MGRFNGTEVASFRGFLAGFMPDAPKLIIYNFSDNISRLFSVEGHELANFEGRFYDVTPDHQGVVTYSDAEQKYRLFALDGRERASFPGIFGGWQFVPDGQRYLWR